MISDIPKDQEELTKWFEDLFNNRPFIEIHAPGSLKGRDEAYKKADELIENVLKQSRRMDK